MRPAGPHVTAPVSLEQLDQMAKSMSDTECAKRMDAAKSKLLLACKIESPFPPRFR